MSEARETDYGIEYEATVVESRATTPTTHAIKVTRHPDFDYEPVQFTFLSIKTPEDPDYSDYRSMSLASPPTRPHLEYGVRISDSPWKKAFGSLKRGNKVLVEGAVGDFILDEDHPAVFLAGGIGITPLKGMAEYAADRKLDIPVTLLYSNRSVEEIAFRSELEALVRSNPHFRLVHTLTRVPPGAPWDGRRGRIDAALLKPMTAQQEDARFYVCGTPEMVANMIETLRALKVSASRIHQERFWGYE